MLLEEIASGKSKGNYKAVETALKSLDSETYGNLHNTQTIQIEAINSMSEEEIKARLKALDNK